MQKLILSLLALSLFLAVGCEKEKEDPQETITTVTLSTESPIDSFMTFTWENKSGGTAPETVDTIRLSPLTSYTFTTNLYDRSGSNDINIGEEVAEESVEHLLIYTETGTGMTVAITDTDTAGDPLGLMTTIITDQPGTGTLRIVLKHEPDKAAADPSLTGETDVDVTFPVIIE